MIQWVVSVWLLWVSSVCSLLLIVFSSDETSQIMRLLLRNESRGAFGLIRLTRDCVSISVCVCERERGREGEREQSLSLGFSHCHVVCYLLQCHFIHWSQLNILPLQWVIVVCLYSILVIYLISSPGSLHVLMDNIWAALLGLLPPWPSPRKAEDACFHSMCSSNLILQLTWFL